MVEQILISETGQLPDETPAPQKRTRKPSAYNMFVSEKRKEGLTLKESIDAWKQQKLAGGETPPPPQPTEPKKRGRKPKAQEQETVSSPAEAQPCTSQTPKKPLSKKNLQERALLVKQLEALGYEVTLP